MVYRRQLLWVSILMQLGVCEVAVAAVFAAAWVVEAGLEVEAAVVPSGSTIDLPVYEFSCQSQSSTQRS